MNRIVHDFVQGSSDWIAHRMSHHNASEAAAMLGIDPKMTRGELLRLKASGDVKGFSEWMQENVLNKGHEYEAIARPWAEEEIGEDLYPSTVSIQYEGLALSGSCDGMTMDDTIIFEHKSLNSSLDASLKAGVIPAQFLPQMEQCLMVTGASKCLFMASSGDRDTMVRRWYEGDPDIRKEIIAGWKQFQKDLAEYQHVEVLPSPAGKAIITLPSLNVKLIGEVTESNLITYRTSALAFIEDIKTDLKTDQDFADAEKTVKFCGDVEDDLKLVKKQAIAQTASIDELFRTIDMLQEAMRSKRLELEKIVKVRKESIRIEIKQEFEELFDNHLASLWQRLGSAYTLPKVPCDFANAMKGKKTVSSLRDASSAELSKAKIAANEIADRMSRNLALPLGEGYEFLFPDRATLIWKPEDDYKNVVELRIAQHKVAEEKRLADEREKIRAEELVKIEREQEAERLKAVAQQPSPPVNAEPQTFSKVGSLLNTIPKPPINAPLVGNWRFAITDIKHFLKFIGDNHEFQKWINFDEAAIQQYANSTKGKSVLPGIEFYQSKKEA